MDPKLRSALENAFVQIWLSRLQTDQISVIIGRLSPPQQEALVRAISGREPGKIGDIIITEARQLAKAKAVTYVDTIEAQGNVTFAQLQGLLL